MVRAQSDDRLERKAKAFHAERTPRNSRRTLHPNAIAQTSAAQNSGLSNFTDNIYLKNVALATNSYGNLNGDRYFRGQRWFANGSITLSPEFSLISFYQHEFGNDIALPNRQRLNVSVS